MTSTPATTSLDTWSAVLRLAAAWAIGILTITLMPLEVSALMSRHGWSEGMAGAIAGVQVLGIVATCALLPRPVARFGSRAMLVVLAVLAASQIATAYATAPMVIGMLRFFVGVCEGVMIVSAGACLASHHNSEILWGKVIFASGLFVAVMLTGLAYLPDVLQQQGVWIGLGTSELLLGSAVLKLPSMRRPVSHAHAQRPKATPAVLAVWSVMAVMYTVQQGQWTIAGLHGVHQGMSGGQTGFALAIASMVGYAGCVITSFSPLRLRRVTTGMVCLVSMGLALAWFFNVKDAQGFFYSQLALNLAFNGLTPLVNAALTEKDTDGSLLSRSVVIAFAAASVGTIGSGAVLEQLGPAAFGGLGALLLLCTLPLAVAGLRRAGTEESEACRRSNLSPR